MVQQPPPVQAKQSVPLLAWLLATVVSTLFSPSLWLLHVALSHWVDFKSLFISPYPGPEAFYALVLQLKSLGAVVLLTQLMPTLLLCLGVGVLYHWGLLKLFRRASRLLPLNRFTAS
jgi:hypothetical protein